MKYDIQPGVKGLIFDLDGTLVDSMPYHLASWKIACESFGIKMTQEYLHQHAGTPGWAIARELIILNQLESKVTVEEFIDKKASLFNSMQKWIKPIEPVAAIVKKYFGILPMAIGTGGSRSTVERSLKYAGLTKYFDIIVTATDIQNFKPHPETFLKCAEAMEVDPSVIEVFEDGILGIRAALQAGMIATNVQSWYDSDWEKVIEM
jgi:beta-phosphoglucomutase-like phosphatase (HAD superfamily)